MSTFKAEVHIWSAMQFTLEHVQTYNDAVRFIHGVYDNMTAEEKTDYEWSIHEYDSEGRTINSTTSEDDK